MPAMHLIRVDLPAPLSPTSAITSPCRTSRSTSVSAWTEPNDFETPRSSRRGWSLTPRFISHEDGRRRPERGRLRHVSRFYLQYFEYVPLQTSPFFRNPEVKRSL